jgi:hypothetical protein
MNFDNGLFSLELPAGWAAEDGEDGNVYITHEHAEGVWVSIEPGGVDGEGKAIDAAEFVHSAYADKLSLQGAEQSVGSDGRVVVRWSETQEHEGTLYTLCHGLAAWSESASNLQMLMFQAAYPRSETLTPYAQEAQALAWAAPAALHFYRWRSPSAA